MVVFGNIRGLAIACVAVLCLSACAEAQNQEGGQPGARRGGAQQGGRGGQPGGQPGQRGGFGGGGFGGGGFGGPGGGAPPVSRATLLGVEKVREELKIEEAQGATIEAALEAYREEQRSSFQGLANFREMSDEERTAAREKMMKTSAELNKKTDDVLNALLEPAQVTRLDQIALQVRLNSGLPAALKADDLKEKLKISEDQVAKLTTVEEGMNKKRMEMFEGMRGQFQPGGGGGAPPDREAMQAQIEKMRAEGEKLNKAVSEETMALLTDDQKKTLDTMKGSPFELDLRAMMGGRGGFGGGFGGGRPPGAPGGAPGGGRRERPTSDNDKI